jgi:hypothetical protein
MQKDTSPRHRPRNHGFIWIGLSIALPNPSGSGEAFVDRHLEIKADRVLNIVISSLDSE